jgi:hypothetical protein
MTYRGVIVVESLVDECVLETPGVVVSRVQRLRTDDPAVPVWTLLEVEIPDGCADDLATQLADAIRPGPWYADFGSATSRTVVFRGRSFTYRVGDLTARREVEVYGRSIGIPERQLDWAE